jgi:hypothetical protein
MLEASIQMSLRRKQHNMLEMCMVDMCINSEQSLEDNLDNVDKIFWERHS